MEDTEILSRFLNLNVNLHPDALTEIKRSGNVEEFLSCLISNARKDGECPLVITPQYLQHLSINISRENAGASITFSDKEIEIKRPKKRFLSQEYDSKFNIDGAKDITGKSCSSGNLEDFVHYFNSRFEKLSRILRNREDLQGVLPLDIIERIDGNDEIKIIGMVNGIRTSKKGNLLLEMEDPTGVNTVLVTSANDRMKELSREIIMDEILGVKGRKWNGIIIADEVYFPDIPRMHRPNQSQEPLALALISDIHAGSREFLEGDFNRFIKWIKGDLGNQRQKDLAQKVKYVMIGGDLVDGVGIYPDQIDDLVISDIYEQYGMVARLIQEIPDHIEIVVIPGNHDAVRIAEPQPAIPEEFAEPLYKIDNVHMTSNPARVNFSGVNLLSYHGKSLDDVISSIPGLSYSEPVKAMTSLLKKRHLSPIFGNKTPLSPEGEDYLLIEDPPDILHFGHVHTVGVEKYRGTTVVNSGTFQSQTDFQKKVNLNPDPGKIPIIELDSLRSTLMTFHMG